MPKQDSKKKEYRVFLPGAISEEIDRLVDNGIYDTPSEVLRDIIREWYKERRK